MALRGREEPTCYLYKALFEEPPMNQNDPEQNESPWQKNINRPGGGFSMPKGIGSSGRSIPGAVATQGADVRMTFIRKTYAHLTGAIFLFAALEYLFLGPLYESVALPALNLLGGNWAIVLIAFMGVSWIADKWANSSTSRNMQYLGLGLYVVAEAVIFIPLLLIASNASFNMGGGPNVIPTAAIATLAIFGVLTAIVFTTKKDFSFLRKGLMLGGFVAMGLIFASIFFKFELGMIFTVAMIAFAAMYILYHTSQIMAHYHPQQYVAASLALFSSVALLFWYVIRLVMSLSRD